MINANRGVSLVKIVVVLALVTGALMAFASMLLDPIRADADDKYNMKKRPALVTLARDVAPTNGIVVSVTGVVTAKYDTDSMTVVVLGAKDKGQSIPCYFNKRAKGVDRVRVDRVATVKGITKTSAGTTWLRRAELYTDISLKSKVLAERKADKDAQNVKQEPEPMSGREIARVRQQQLWNQANRPGQQNGPRQMNYVRQ